MSTRVRNIMMPVTGAILTFPLELLSNAEPID
jgi:hypothetical protein